MPGIRPFDVRAALAALGLAMLAALAVAVVTHLPSPALSGPTTQTSGGRLSRLQSLPLQAQSVISSTIAADSPGFAARRTAAGWGLSGGDVRADFRGGEPTLTAGGRALSLSLAGAPAPTSVRAHGNRVTLTRPGIREWYAAGPLGIEQGFTLAHRPAARATGDRLTLSLAVGGALRARAAGSDISFVGPRGDVVARYGGLSAVDARGRHLPGTLSVSHGRVVLTVNDRAARYPITIDPLVQQAKLVPNDETFLNNGSSSGTSVAISSDGNTVIAGGILDNGDLGAAWVFTRSGSTWSQQGGKLVPSNPAGTSTDFGQSVALSADGNTALIGGENDGVPAFTGAAWVFVRSGSAWTQQTKLTGAGETGTADFGHSAALSSDGNTAIVGGPADNNGAGAAWVFTRSGSNWTQQTKIAPTASVDNVGRSVALSGDGNTALIGAPQSGGNVGAAYVYTRSGSIWTQRKVIDTSIGGVITDASGSAEIGSAVSLSTAGTTALIGGHTDGAGAQGAAWVVIGSGASWTEQQKLTGSNLTGTNNDFGFGVSLSGDGNTAAIGARQDAGNTGATFLFTRSGTQWLPTQSKIGGPGPSDFFGTSVALASDGQTIAVGAPGDSSGIGATFVLSPPDPVCSSVAANTPQGGGSANVLLSCTLPAGAHPVYSILGGPSNGTVSGFNPSTGQLTYTSAAFFSGQDSFTYRVRDQWGISNIATATLITPFLPVPRCSNVTARGKRGATRVTIKLKCTGPAGHRFTYGIVSKPGNGRLSKIKHGKVTYTTHVGFSGSDRFVYNATDSGGSSRAATATIVLPKLGRITSTMTWPQDFGAGAASTVIPDLIVKNLPGGAKVKLSCSKGCPIKARTLALAKHRVCKGKGKKRKCKMAAPKTGNLDLGRYVAHRRVKVGAQITVAMIQAGSIGKEYVFRMLKNNQPSVKIQTLAPGSTKLCPSC
jgi:hypothetical protein